MSPTQRSLAQLRSLGFTAEIVEKRIPHAFITLAAPESLRLNDPINGHRAVCAGLGRGINHAADILMKGVSHDVDGAVPELSDRS